MFISKYSFIILFCFIFFSNGLQGNDSIENPNSEKSLSILSWNIKMFSHPYGWLHNTVERSDSIIEILKNHETYDVILFQQAFSIGIRNKIYNALDNIYPNQIETNDNTSILKNNSGLWAISSVPIRLIENINFTELRNYDWFSSKGAHLYSVEKCNQEFHIINTHMQADYETNYYDLRMKQYTEINEKLILPFESFQKPLFLCGDLNISKELKLKEMLSKLDLINGPLLGKLQHSILGENHILLDYILIKKTKFQFQSIERRILDMSEKNFELSDHYPIEGIMKW